MLLFGFVGIAFLLATAGCSTGGGSRRNRGNLSDAVAQAGENDEEGRGEGHTRTRTDHQNQSQSESYTVEDDDSGGGGFFGFVLGLFGGGDDDEGQDYQDSYTSSSSSSYGAAGGSATNSQNSFDHRSNIMLGYAQAYPNGDTMTRVATGSLAYSRYFMPRFRGHVGAYYGTVRKGPNELVQDGIGESSGDFQEFGAEIGARNYLTADHTAVGVYILYGIRLGGLAWKYTEPISTSDGDTVEKDTVFIGTPFMGLGCALVQTEGFQLGVNGTWGARLGAKHTAEGYANDLFREDSEWCWKVEMTVFFR